MLEKGSVLQELIEEKIHQNGTNNRIHKSYNFMMRQRWHELSNCAIGIYEASYI